VLAAYQEKVRHTRFDEGNVEGKSGWKYYGYTEADELTAGSNKLLL